MHAALSQTRAPPPLPGATLRRHRHHRHPHVHVRASAGRGAAPEGRGAPAAWSSWGGQGEEEDRRRCSRLGRWANEEEETGGGHRARERVQTWLPWLAAGAVAVGGLGGDAALAAGVPAADGKFFQADKPEGFTVYGNIFKRYTIQDLDEKGRVVNERRGFTATSCVNVVPNSVESPQFNGMPEMAKVNYNDGQSCRKAVSQSKEESCRTPCESSCDASLAKYAREELAVTGLEIPAKDLEKIRKRCRRTCLSDCSRPGTSFTFVIPYRP